MTILLVTFRGLTWLLDYLPVDPDQDRFRTKLYIVRSKAGRDTT